MQVWHKKSWAFSDLPLSGESLVTPLRGGKNNRVYLVEEGKKKYILKQYFSHVNDQRDRLASEIGFFRFLRAYGELAIPEFIQVDEKERFALFEFIEGKSFDQSAILEGDLEQAQDFFLRMNAFREQARAHCLSTASEAFFTFQEHLTCVQNRVDQLLKGVKDRVLESFIKEELNIKWQRVRSKVQVFHVKKEDIACLSPSDFAFHNALKQNNGRIIFYDFEYAGWDDPAKMLCDFFLQVQCPVPMKYFDHFIRGIQQSLRDVTLYLRVKELMPIYRIKWVCILMNAFLPGGQLRREFSGEDPKKDFYREQQLIKCRRLIRAL